MPWQKYLLSGCRPAVKSGNNKITYKDIWTALPDATNDLSMPCHEQQTGAATAREAQALYTYGCQVFKTGYVVGPINSIDCRGTYYHTFEGIILGIFLFNYIDIVLFLKSPLWKVFSTDVPVNYMI